MGMMVSLGPICLKGEDLSLPMRHAQANQTDLYPCPSAPLGRKAGINCFFNPTSIMLALLCPSTKGYIMWPKVDNKF